MQRQISALVQRQLSSRSRVWRQRKSPSSKFSPRSTQPVPINKEIVVPASGLDVNQFAAVLEVPVQRVLRVARDIEDRGLQPNDVLGGDVMELVAEDIGRKVVRQTLEWTDERADTEGSTTGTNSVTRKVPVVAVMGHVDHGKTTLLEALRGKGGLVEGEVGGITQRIGAFQVDIGGNRMTILDTPGHEAFMSMRTHGAIATDLIILVVAADDGVMPQTVEAVRIARSERVPFIVAINKCDKPGAKPDRIRTQLSTLTGIRTEELGGDVQCVEISAIAKTGLKALVECLALQSELLELRADVDARAAAVVVESRSTKSQGTGATVIIQQGTLKLGDHFFFTSINATNASSHGTVKVLQDTEGRRIEKCLPGEAALLIGLSDVPEPGARLYVQDTEKEARKKASEVALRNLRAAETRSLADSKLAQQKALNMIEATEPSDSDGLLVQSHDEPVPTMNVVVKSGTVGSVEAVIRVLSRLSDTSFPIRIIHSGVGDVTESDVFLAGLTNKGKSMKGAKEWGIVVAFGIRKNSRIATTARQSQVPILYHKLIYKLEDEFRDMKEKSLRARQETEKVVGVAEVMQGFNNGLVAGCLVKNGYLSIGDKARVLRFPKSRSKTEKEEIFEGRIKSLKKFSDDVRKAEKGAECGLSLEGWDDFRSGDVVESISVSLGQPGVFLRR